MPSAEDPYGARNNGVAISGEASDADGPGAEVSEACRRGVESVEFDEAGADVGEEQLTFRRRGQAVAHPVEQGDADCCLEVRDGAADGRLCDLQ